MKTLRLLLLICAFLVPAQSAAEQLRVPALHLDLNTQKVSHLLGEITQKSANQFLFEQASTSFYAGDRLVLIDSPGGDVDAGKKIMDSLVKEQEHGTKLVCLVFGTAASMAFNILSHCDVRVSTKQATFLFHHCALSDFPVNVRMTSQHLKEISDEMERIDEQFCAVNSKALHLSRALYEKLANSESYWSPRELLSRKYLDAVIDTYQ